VSAAGALGRAKLRAPHDRCPRGGRQRI